MLYLLIQAVSHDDRSRQEIFDKYRHVPGDMIGISCNRKGNLVRKNVLIDAADHEVILVILNYRSI